MRFPTAVGFLTVVMAAASAKARDYVSMASSLTVLLFATIIAE